VSTPRDPDAQGAMQAMFLIDPAIKRARLAGLHVTAPFQRELTNVARRGVTRAKGDTVAVQRAIERLVAESVRIAKESDDPTLEPEHLQRAKNSLCPLWPVC
jgi:hypothetical protein